MKRIFICLILIFSLLPYINGEDYYDGQSVTIHGIIYALSRDGIGTATAIGSPTSETGYSDLVSNAYGQYYYEYYPPTTHKFKDYIDSCGGVLTFPETIIVDGERFTLTTIAVEYNPNLKNKNPYAWNYNGIGAINVVLPKTVTNIDDDAFNSNVIKNITLSNNVKRFGSSAFNVGLRSITISETGETSKSDSCLVLPSELKEIGCNTFRGCTFFNKIKVNPKLEEIGSFAFASTNLTSFDFPVKITEIFQGTFSECIRLERVNLNNVTTILGPEYYSTTSNSDTAYTCGAFYRCNRLRNIDLKNIQILGTGAFSKCSALQSVDVRKVESIRAGTFNGCRNIEDIYMPNVTRIETNAFRNCSNLQIDLNNVEYIGNGSFYGCHLNEVDLGNANYIGDKAFAYCDLSEVDLNTAKHVGREAFLDCNLTEVNIPKSTYFGIGPFYRCKIKKIMFEEGRDSITNSFFGGTELDSIIVPEGVTFIGDGALNTAAGSYYFTTEPQYEMDFVVLPSTLKTLGTGILGPVILSSSNTAWYHSTYLKRLIVLAETPPKFLNYINFTNPLGIERYSKIYVPDASVWAYQNSPGWNKYFFSPISQLTGINNVTIDNAGEQGADDGIYYDLQGRKVTNPQKGVYIHQGKKVIISSNK